MITPITSHNYHFSFVVRTYKIYSLSHIQVFNAALLTTIPMLLVRSPEVTHFILRICTLWLTFPHFPCSPGPGNHSLLLVSRSLTFIKIPSICDILQYLPFSTWLISLTDNALKVHPSCCNYHKFPSFPRLNIPLCIYTYSLYIHAQMDTCVVPTSWLLWMMLQWTQGCRHHFQTLI